MDSTNRTQLKTLRSITSQSKSEFNFLKFILIDTFYIDLHKDQRLVDSLKNKKLFRFHISKKLSFLMHMLINRYQVQVPIPIVNWH